ncbi:hypothetical protein RhiTH_008711 [Rhizoctonia solani]
MPAKSTLIAISSVGIPDVDYFTGYIFTFKEGTGENSPQAIKAKEFIKSQGGKITHDYGETGFAAEVPEQGYANIASFTDNDLADAVEAVEEDGIVTTQ